MREPESNPDERQIMATTASAILGTPLAAWSEALTCAARNSLKVVLSGTEFYWKITRKLATTSEVALIESQDNAYHLCHLISLLGPEEFKLDQMSADEIKQIRHVAGTRIS